MLGKLKIKIKSFYKNPRLAGGIYFLQGIIVFALTLVCLFSLANFLNSKPQISQSQIIKNILVKQNSAIIVGNPVKWVAFVDVKNISKNKNYISLPKNAKNIKIEKISNLEVAKFISRANENKNQKITQEKRIELAGKFSFKNILAKISSSFLASVEDGISEITNQDSVPVIETPTATVVDLSAQAILNDQAPNSNDQIIVPETPTLEAPALSEPILPEIPLVDTTSPANQAAVENPEPEVEPILSVQEKQEIVKVEYETQAPTIIETEKENGKVVTISAEDETVVYTDVLAHANIPEIYKVGQEDKIKIKWKNNGNQDMEFHAYDLNGNGKLDYVEWTVPHLSEQIFDIIFISKAWQLDNNKEIVADIYDQVMAQDDSFATVPVGNYVRATFKQVLNNTNDITIFAKSQDPMTNAQIQVFPVYTDADGNQTQGQQLEVVNDGTNLDFSNITENGKYRILLVNLQTPTDVFDLKVLGGSVDFDYIVDPGVTLYWVGGAGGNTSVKENWNTSAAACSGAGDASAAPVAADTVNFVSNCTNSANIDSTFTVASLVIATGYTGTISQTAGVAVTTSAYSQAAGTFTATENLTVKGNFTKSGGTFTAGSGTVSFGPVDGLTINLSSAETFNNVAINLTYNFSALTISNQKMIVSGNLAINTGTINTGTIDVGGNITQGVATYGGSATINFVNDDPTTGAQTYTVNGGVGPTVRFDSAADLADSVFFAANGTLQGIIFTYATAGVELPVNCNGKTVVLNNFTQVDGIFTPANNITIGTFTFSGGVFNAPANMTIANSYTKTGSGTFNEGTNTVTFGTLNGDSYNSTTVETFYNVIVNQVYSFSTLNIANQKMVVSNDLTITQGIIINGAVDVYGNVTVAANGAASGSLLTFTGSNTQTLNLSGATSNINCDVTIDKAAGQVNLASALTFDAVNQDLLIQKGTLYLAGNAIVVNGSSGKLIVSSGGNLQVQGAEAITTNSGYPQFDNGSNMTYVGTSGPYTIKNYQYAGLIINSSGQTFNLPAALSVYDLTVSSGTLDVTASNYNIVLRGNISVAGTLNNRSNTVYFAGKNQSVTGNITFYNLSKIKYNYAPVGLGASLWLDGADSSSLTVGAGSIVTTWADKSGNSRNATPGNSGTEPTVHGSYLNGLNTLNMSTTGKGMNVAYTLSATPYTLYIVYNTTGSSTGRRAIQGSVNNWLIGPYSGNQKMYGGTGFVGTGPAVVSGTFVIAGTTNNGSAASFYVNGTNYATSPGNVGTPGLICLGGYSGAGVCGAYGEPLSGDIAEILVFPSALGTTDRVNLECYLSSKWGISTANSCSAATNYDFSCSGDSTITFQAASTTTIGGVLTFGGVDSNNRLNLVSSSPGTSWNLISQSTQSVDYVDVTDSNASGGNTIVSTNTVNGGNNLNWSGAAFNTAPNAPTRVLPRNGSINNNPTPLLSASYSDPDANDVGTTKYRVATSAADCLSGTSLSASGTSSATSTNSENTTWTTSALSPDGTYYWCAQNDDGVTQSAWTSMGSFTLDTTPPSGGSITYTNGYFTSTSVAITYSTGTDSGVGLDTASGKIQRADATLASGVCGPYVEFSDLVSEFDGSYTDTTVVSGNCYKYQYLISDTLGSQVIYTSANEAKVDAITPTTTDDFANNNVWVTSNQTITLTPADAGGSAIASTKYCTDTNNTCVVSSGTSYTTPVTVSTSGVSYFRYASVDNAGNTQTTVSRTIEIDNSAPATGSITYADGYFTSASVAITYSTGTDSGSGLNNSSGKIQRASATLSNGTCGSFSSFADLVTEFDGSYTDTTVISGNCYKYQYIIADNILNTATYTSANVAKVDTTAPTTADDYGAKNDVWQNANQTIALTPTDSGGSGLEWTKYCIDTNNSCVPVTSYELPVTVSSEGTSYFNYASKDNAQNTQTTVSKIVKIDKSAPTTVADAGTYVFGETSTGDVTVTLTCADASGSGCSSTLYCIDTADTCTPTDIYVLPITVITEGTNYFRYSSTDFVSNVEITSSQVIKITRPVVSSGGGGVGGVNIHPTPASQPTVPVIQNPNLIEQVIKQITGQNTEQITYPPITQVVPEEPQMVFRGGVVISKTKLDEIAILPLPEEIKNLALKFPQFGETLEKVGITKPDDVAQLQATQLVFPGLAEASGASAFLPLKNFTELQTQQIPTGFIFARVGSDNIDLNTKVSISELGAPSKTIKTIENKPLYLVVKPDNKAKSVIGFVIFKSAKLNSAKLFSASLLDATNIKENPKEVVAQKDIVLAQFNYEDLNNDGVWEAQIKTPAVDGNYEIRTEINYVVNEKQKQEKETLSMIMVVDPEGYIYRKVGADEARVSNAKVSIYWQDPKTNEFVLWPAKDFLQQNPQTTDKTGKYSFLVPVGKYYLEVQSSDYATYKGQIFEVTEGSGIHQNIELKPKNWWLKVFTIERLMIALVIILLFTILITIILKKKTK